MTDDALLTGLRRVAASPRLLVALDFDGTLAPLRDEPMTARMTAEARAAVDALAALPDTAVAFVSGRSLADLTVIAEYDDASPVLLAGSHGVEFRHPAEYDDPPAPRVPDEPAIDRVLEESEEAVAGVEGAWIERKTYGFCVHTRLSSQADAAAATSAVDGVVARWAPHWRRRTGRDIVEYSWRHEGKDTAVAALRALTRADAVVFAGDDVTDEDALAALGADDLGIRVGEGRTHAQVRVRDTAELAAALGQLARMRVAARQ